MYDYPMECGCGRKNCPAVRGGRGRRRGRVEGTEERPPAEEDEPDPQTRWVCSVSMATIS